MVKRKRRRQDRSEWHFPPHSTPKRVEGGVKAKSQRGKFGDTWWADRWIEVLESFGWDTRLQRGRSYARRGQVLEYHVSSGLVTAKVQGSRAKPYDVEIMLKPLSIIEWERVTDAMADQAIFAAKLLSGEMPRNIEEAFTATKLTLFPESAKDLETECSCPDWANPCKHIAAVYYLLGEEFDRDPFMLFYLRGIGREELTTSLREKRSADVSPEAAERPEAEREPEDAVPPLEECLDRFWVPAESMAGFRVSIEPPPVPEALLKRLGPLHLEGSRQDLAAMLEGIYRTASERALEVAFGEGDLS